MGTKSHVITVIEREMGGKRHIERGRDREEERGRERKEKGKFECSNLVPRKKLSL